MSHQILQDYYSNGAIVPLEESTPVGVVNLHIVGNVRRMNSGSNWLEAISIIVFVSYTILLDWGNLLSVNVNEVITKSIYVSVIFDNRSSIAHHDERQDYKIIVHTLIRYL